MIKRILNFDKNDWKHILYLLKNCLIQGINGNFEELQDKNEKLKNTSVEKLEEYIGHLEHENELLYERLDHIIKFASKDIK